MSAPDSDVASSLPANKSSPQITTGKKTHQQQKGQQQQPREGQPQRPPRGEGGSNKSQQSGNADGVQKEKQQNRGPQGGSNDPKSGEKAIAAKSVVPANKQVVTIKSTAGGAPRLALFDHLPRKQPMVDAYSMEGESSLHPATIKLGLLYRTGSVYSDDDRVVALLAAFMKVIEDYKTPPNKQLSWDLDKHIRAQVQHLVHCRQHSMGMGNVIKYIRYEISHIPPECSEAEAKAQLSIKLQSFLEERIVYARESIVRYMITTIKEDDVILTFGSSPLLRQVLLKVAAIKRFRLIVVDTRPLNEGLETLAALSLHVSCVYTPLTGAASVMREVTRVVLGASSLLSNGSMLAPAGTAMVASLAKARRVPVIVVSESYKFCEKVQLDSIVYNELGCAGEIACTKQALLGPQAGQSSGEGVVGCGSILIDSTTSNNPPTDGDDGSSPAPRVFGGYRGAADKLTAGDSNTSPSFEGGLPFQVVNLRYDVTPIGNISVIATETGLIPPTSIPVLIRELRPVEPSGHEIDRS